MSIREQILADIKEAMKAKDEFKRDTLRTLNAALKQVEVDQRIEMTDEVVLPLLQKEIKKRADSVELYIKGAREDLAKKEQGEIELIKAYLPAQLSDEELKEKIKKIIERAGKNLGAVMKMAKDEIGASAEAKRISMIAKELLA
ncbi:GatB/YqeY domain-containing protein [Campylobacter concisus]|uniref:GatB/YqeY domain-containing protein n=1 Tax=Campylobacter concisus TaxID=199 RepID=UPI0009261075|nr:GatB/YqeY domain-containing protein [Campylobacter concisus]MDO4875660.1 GatB/YqeY domain-containing protein [Campylobacter sp.]OJJ28977.1 glutamyl-tRNA amidotransferase [Campylobacter concisus]ORI04046.1 glutamyl-tRNA amidotransferase [Campylobacter concisus]OUT15404.1 glutamyl-tRNA amidotransferase [Campylobacter concisus]QPH99450.1 GatB/YqeY domain-containing protein [Campylobacter concisus]